MQVQTCIRTVLGTVLIGLSAVLATPVVGEQISFTDTVSWPAVDVSSENPSTNWLDLSVSLEKFDESLGILQQIELVLVGSSEGLLRAENRVANGTLGSDLSGTVGSLITLAKPDMDEITFANATVDVGPDHVVGYDFVPWAGNDVNDWGVLDSGDVTSSMVLIEADDLALFSAPSSGVNISLPISAVSLTTASGSAGNIAWESTDLASAAVVTVTYTYVPEPTTVAFVVLGACFVAQRAGRRGRLLQ